jgi:hypothetical protein
MDINGEGQAANSDNQAELYKQEERSALEYRRDSGELGLQQSSHLSLHLVTGQQ